MRTKLSDTQREAEALASRMDAQDFDVANADVKAPVDGTVVGLTVFTRAAWCRPGFQA